MHLTNCWIHRAALRICLVAVSERLAREERKVPVLVIGLENLMSVRVAGMDNLAAAYVRRGVLRDRGQVMPANVGAFALMTVIDMSLVWMRDFGDLTDAVGGGEARAYAVVFPWRLERKSHTKCWDHKLYEYCAPENRCNQ